jgi:hypothetical protein
MIGFQTGNPLAILDELKTLAAPVTTFFSGGKYAPRSQAMDQNLKDTIMSQYDKTGIMSGVLGYSDFDKSQTPGTAFPNLPLMSSNLFSGKVSPAQFSNAMTGGRLTYDINPDTGKVNFGSNEYNFRPEMATIDPSDPYGQQAFSYFAGKANERNREINPDISIPVDYLRGFGRDFSQFGDIPTKEERQGIMNIETPKGFDYNFDENVLKEEEDAQYNLDNKRSFNMDGILQNLGGYAKDAAGRYIGSQALGGAGAMLLGPVGGIVGGIAGLLGGRDLFNSPYIGAGAYTMDQYGNMYTADQLNKMNARGGYYSEPARDSRRRDQSIRKMEERKAQGLSYGINRLEQLKQQAAQEETARQSALDAYFGGSDAGADSGRFDGASSRSEYDSNPTGYSGSS